MLKMYLAIPYSSPYVFMRESRKILADRMAAHYMEQGYIVFSPISHTADISKYTKLLYSWDFWKKQDFPMIEWCDVLCVLCIPGWEESAGVQDEIDYARSLGKKVVFVNNAFVQEVLYG